MHTTIEGAGKPLVLVHGLGSNSGTWRGLVPKLAQTRKVITVDLPGHGHTPAEADSGTFDGLARSLDSFLAAENLGGADMVGSSLGGRLVLEMARRGRAGAVVALDPGGFWDGWERRYFKTTLLASGALLRGLGGFRRTLARNAATRTLLLSQLAARPWRLDGNSVAAELDALAATPTFGKLVRDLAQSPMQTGPAAPSTRRIAIGWGRHDRLCLPAQSARAQSAFPSARLHWFVHSGHFPHWEEPEQTVQLIRETIAD